MAPIKFEEHIREQLEKREIQPSEKSWEKLNARLENEGSKKSSKWWIGVAAAVIVCLVVSLFFIDQQKQTATPIVENPIEVKPGQNSSKFEKQSEIASEEKTEDKIEEVQEKSTLRKVPNSPKIEEKKVQNAVAGIEITKPEPVKEEAPAISEKVNIAKLAAASEPKKDAEIENSILNNKIEELVAKVSKQEKDGETVSNAEVDALLAEAARQLSTERKFYSHGKVDANELLADVEADIDESFREEIFKLLKEGFIKAKTAVATRNY